MFIGLYGLTRENHWGISVKRYKYVTAKTIKIKKKLTNSCYKYMKEPFFPNSNNTIGAYR